MSVDNLKERLAAMNDSYQDAKTFSSDELPPDGEYQAIVERFDFFEGKSSPHDVFLVTELRIQLDPEWEGRIAKTIHNLTDAERLGFVKSHLKTLGLGELDDFSTLEEVLPEALDVPVLIAVKTSERTDSEGKPYRNVYVNERLGDPLERSDVPVNRADFEPAPTPAGADEDPIPF